MRSIGVRVAVQRLARSFGYMITRVPRSSWEAQAALLRDRPVRTILDVGANVGDVTAAYREHFPDAVVHAFEPFPDCLERLQQRFGDDPQVSLVAAAAGDVEGTRTLYVSTGTTTHSLLPRSETGRDYFPNRTSVRGELEVPVVTIDGFCREREIGQVDVLKVDAEGSEVLVFRGACELLGAHRALLVFTEVTFVEHFAGQPLFPEIWEALGHYGYTFYDLFDLQRAPNGQLRFGNAVFVSPELRDCVLPRASA